MMNGKITYRQQYTRCGKERCRKCKEGNGHGPYWYAYWSENGRTVSKYIGVHLPAEVAARMAQQEPRTSEQHISPGTSLLDTGPRVLTRIPPGETEPVRTVPLQLPEQVLRVYTLGQLRIERLQDLTWSPIENRVWQRRRARSLLGCLLSSPGRRLGREQIMEALWPDLDIDTAANRLNGAVHELRQILEPEIDRPAASRMLRLERDMLFLAERADIWVDAEAFESLINEAHQINTQQITLADVERLERLLGEADALYTGDYLLEELYAEWAAPRREALKRNWIGLQLKLSELREAQEKPVSAMEPLNRLLAADPTNETAVQRLMLLLTQLDRRGEALNAYRRLAARLRQTYESEPLPETRSLYEKLRQGQSIHRTDHPSITILKETQEPAKSEQEENALSSDTQASSISQPGDNTLLLSTAALIAAAVNQFGRVNQSPLIGREQEMEVLRQLLLALETRPDVSDETAPNRSARKAEKPLLHLTLLTGEAGIGKTRLAEELSHEAASRGWAVTWARAYEQEGAIPYRPWIEVLRALIPYLPVTGLAAGGASHSKGNESGAAHTPTALERLSTLLPELRRFLPQMSREYPPLPPEQERLHLWEAMLELLSALSKAMPLLLVLDDLHWTDDSSRELLAYLVRHLHKQRILFIGTCRDVELAPNDSLRTLIADLRREQAIVTLAVQPLSISQIGSLLSHLPQSIVQRIQTQAGGNPFFAEEMARLSETTSGMSGAARAETEQDSVAPSPGEAAVPFSGQILPEGIAAVLERRLGKLSEQCQTLLGKAAVLGGAFELSQLLSMASEHTEDTLLDLLEEALRAGLLTEEGTGTRITYHFWHPLIVSHLYERLSAARRAQLHRRAASALIQTNLGRENEVAAAITQHLSKGGSEPAQIAYYAELAANQAYSLAAYAEARQYFLQAIQIIAGGSIAGKADDILLPASKSEPSSRTIADPLHVAHLLEFVCECSAVLGDYEEARAYYERILELRNLPARTLTEAERWQEAQIQAMIWREIGRTWSWNGNYDQAHLCYQRGKQVLQEAGITCGAAWACVHLEYGRICLLEGSYDEARQWISEALEMLEQTIEARKNAEVAGSAAREQPESSSSLHPASQTQIERAIAGDPLEVGRARELLGLIAAHVGQYAEALQYLHEALAIFEQHDLLIAMIKVCGNIGAVYLTRSENALAQPYMRRALELAERMSNLPTIAFVTGNLGEQATRQGNLLEAEKWFRRSLAVAEQINEPEHISWCSVALAGTLQDLGQFEEAAACIRRSLMISRAMKSARNIGGALIALGDLRLTQAVIACKIQGGDPARPGLAPPLCRRLLLRARSTLQRAIMLERLEAETVVEGRMVLANVNFMLGELSLAEQLATQTLKDATTYELTRLHARALRLLGRVFTARRLYEQADAYFEESLNVFQQYEMRLDYARALHGYASTLLERSTPGSCIYKKGLSSLREAGEIFAQCHARVDLKWVEQELQSVESETVGMEP